MTRWIARRYKVAQEPIGALVQEAWAMGQRAGLDPTLILAVMAVIESASTRSPRARSARRGLMQVMTRVHGDKYEAFGGTHAAFDPVSNLRVGVQVLRDIARRRHDGKRLKFYVGASTQRRRRRLRRAGADRAGPHLRRVADGKGVPFNAPQQRAPAGGQGSQPRRVGPGERRWCPGAALTPAAKLAPCATGDRGRPAAEVDRPPGSAGPPGRAVLTAVRLGIPWSAEAGRRSGRRLHPEEDCHVRPFPIHHRQHRPEIWAAIPAENRRQEEHIELIASENYTNPAVMAAQGSQLTNKYAEGYPGKRYYGGCENVDVVETAGHRPPEAAVRRRRQRAGQLGLARPTRPCSSGCCSRATRSWA